MAQKKRLTVAKKPISDTVRNRLKKIPGTSRRYVDPKTKKTYSRRQFEKGRIRPPRKNAPDITRKFSKYISIRDVYISSQARKGSKLTKRQAMDNKEFKQLIRDLHTKDSPGQKRGENKGRLKRQAAWEGLTGGEKSEWTPYIQRWVKGDL